MIVDYEPKIQLLERFIREANAHPDPSQRRVAAALSLLKADIDRLNDPNTNFRTFKSRDHGESNRILAAMKSATLIFMETVKPTDRAGIYEVVETISDLHEDLLRMKINPLAFAPEYDTPSMSLKTGVSRYGHVEMASP